jgi:menaquinol-cytochrome c reductase iron-sulfur subunit
MEHKEVTMTVSHDLSRRDFVRIVMTFLGTIMVAVIGLPSIAYLFSPSLKAKESDVWIPAGKIDSYPVGVPTLFSFTRTTLNGWEKTVNSFGAYILKIDDTTTQAFSNICTHLSCRVNWAQDAALYICPCHDGRFSIEGKVVSGPPPKPLNQYETKIENGLVYINFKEG